MSDGAWVLVVALGLATAFGAYRATVDGRFRGTHLVKGAEASEPDGDDHPGPDSPIPVESLGERATLLQFSSAFCAPCRVTRRVLEDVAATVPGVAHVELDAEHHLELVRAWGILRTPTTLVLDRLGRELSRASGAPRRDEVMATLAAALDA